MQQSDIILQEGHYYHLYNRGINGTNLFYEERNYTYFLSKYAHYMCDVLDTYAYCLMKNHFHLLVRVKPNLSSNLNLSSNPTGFQNLSGLEGLEKKSGLHSPDRLVSKKFADLFNSYSKSINKAQNRTGSLFETPFNRILVDNDAYFSQLIWYIHFNPQKHGFVKNFMDYPHSSYHSHLSNKLTKLDREEVLKWFGNEKEYIKFHNLQHNENDFSKLIIEL